MSQKEKKHKNTGIVIVTLHSSASLFVYQNWEPSSSLMTARWWVHPETWSCPPSSVQWLQKKKKTHMSCDRKCIKSFRNKWWKRKAKVVQSFEFRSSVFAEEMCSASDQRRDCPLPCVEGNTLILNRNQGQCKNYTFCNKAKFNRINVLLDFD